MIKSVLNAAKKTLTRMGSSFHDINGMRKAYGASSLDLFLESSLTTTDPFAQFHEWFKYAEKNCKLGFEEVNAMALSTATKDGKPSCRMVLLKGYGEEGFRFFTNYESRKGQQLVQIEGTIKKLPPAIADEYWSKRPPRSQASAFISKQSKPVASRRELEERVKRVETEYLNDSKSIPRPENWGGYVLMPATFEFWHGHEDRLHDRIKFRKLSTGETPNELLHKGENGWYYERLQP